MLQPETPPRMVTLPARDTFSWAAALCPPGSSFPAVAISGAETQPEMKSDGNGALIKMKLRNNPRVLLQHPSRIGLQETDYSRLN